jgi:hypothetical protein
MILTRRTVINRCSIALRLLPTIGLELTVDPLFSLFSSQFDHENGELFLVGACKSSHKNG